MSSRSGDRDRARPWSITTRLTALFAVAAFLILLLSAGILQVALGRALRADDAEQLRQDVASLDDALASPEPSSRLHDEIVVEPAAIRVEPYYLRLMEGDRISLQSAGMEGLVPPEVFPAPARLDQASVSVWRSPKGRTYLILSADAADGSGHTFQAALDDTNDTDLLDTYRDVLAAVVLVGTLVAALAGYLTARHGLDPLARLLRAVERVSPEHLDERVGGEAWPAELAELARVFDGMLARLEDSFGRLSQLSGDLAHELRTPVTNLRSEAEAVLARARPPEEYRRVLESSLDELGRLTVMIDHLLFLARAESGSAAVEPRTLDADEEVRRVVEFYEAVAAERGVTLECVAQGHLVADPLLFRRALSNLVSNAIEHTPTGGRVAVELTHEAEGVRLDVTDTGSGIPAEHLPHVTDRFYQVDPAREKRGGGSGLGLALVRTIAELHGGSLSLKSEIGRGTRASLVFPEPALPRT